MQLTQPAGWLDGKDAVGSQGGVVGGPNVLTQLNLPSGVNGVNNDFGLVLPSVVSGFVYLDHENNGVKDPGDPGIAGVVVTLTGTDDLGNAVNYTTSTDGNGFYWFGTLRPGNYLLTKQDPSGYLKGVDTTGSLGGSVAANQLGVTLTSGSNAGNYNFAELLPPPGTPAMPPSPFDFSKLFFIGDNWLS